MKINWKAVSQCTGYISMKAAVAAEAKKCAKWKRKPDERYQQSFNFAINRAKHYAYHLNKSIIEILDDWEEKRTYSFINYYQDCHFSKFHSNSKKQPGLRSVIKGTKKCGWGSKASRRRRIVSAINFYQMQQSTKKKKRWSSDRKKRGY